MPWQIETHLLSSPEPASVVSVKQVHSGKLVWADAIAADTVADGIAARDTFNHPFMIHTADCLPLVVTSSEVACALHVSRKTLLKGLLESVPDFLDIKTITKVHVGPHICSEHFVFETLGEEIVAFRDAYPYACHETSAGIHLSINQVVTHYLRLWGIDETLVFRDGRCTFEAVELPSYRRALSRNQSLRDGIATIVRKA